MSGEVIIYIRDSLGEELQDELKNDYRQDFRSAEIIQKSSLSNFLLPWGSKTVVCRGEVGGGGGDRTRDRNKQRIHPGLCSHA